MAKVCFWIAVLLAASTTIANAGTVLLHAPNQEYGWRSDTSFLLGNSPSSQRLADGFALDAPAIIRQVAWWGDYEGTPLPLNESMRIRFYAADSGSGLPGSMISEAIIANPLRVPTSLLVRGTPGTSATWPEYLFQAELASSVSLDAHSLYWLEIAQLGDSSSRFRWELSPTDGSTIAYSYPADTQWQLDSFPSNLAFQLSTIPEPCTLAMAILCVGLAPRWRIYRRH